MTDVIHQGPTYSKLIVDALNGWGDLVAFASDDSQMTYSEAAALTSRFVQILEERGIERGGGVGALGPNAPEMWLIQAAAYLLGAHFTGLNAMGTAADHIRLVDDAEITVLLVAGTHLDIGSQILKGSTTVTSLLTMGPNDVGENIDDLVSTVEAQPLLEGPARHDDVAWLQYTGGTTGVPKGVMLSQDAMAHQVRFWLASNGLVNRPVYLAAAPITHAAVLGVLPTLVLGGTVVLQQSFTPTAYLAAIEQHRVNYAFAVPTMLYALLDCDDVANYDLSSIATFNYGAAPISPTRLVELIDTFGPVFRQGWGQTETAGVGFVLTQDDHDPVNDPELLTSCGRPVAGLTAAILDDQNRPLTPGEVGEICVRSPTVMTGYWKQPELTAAAFAGDWLHSGDLGTTNERGYFFVVDRLKDMVITGGFKIYPKEVEDVLTAHPSVSAAAVIGTPHEKWGEEVTAYVVTRNGEAIDSDELIALVRAEKGPHFAPKSVHVVEVIPTTAVGKIDKKALRANHWDASERQVN